LSSELFSLTSRSVTSEPVDLEETKNEIVRLLGLEDALMFEIARLVRFIEEHELFRQEVNQDTGNPFRSMSEYLPSLIAELRQRAKLHKLSTRTVREYMAIYRVFHEQLGLPTGKIMEIGPGNMTEIREALDYDRKTGEIADNPKPGKIGKAQALEIMDTIEDADGHWRVADTRQVLDEARGVSRHAYRIYWRETSSGRFVIENVSLYEGDALVDEMITGLSEETALELTKKLGALSNLQEN
jgi:hypothetical protein